MEEKRKSLRKCKWMKMALERFKQLKPCLRTRKENDIENLSSLTLRPTNKLKQTGTSQFGDLLYCDKNRTCKIRTKHCQITCRFGSKSNSKVVMQFFSNVLLTITIAQVLVPLNGCYVFPPGKKDPCEGKTCHLGAICVSSSDGNSARCQCPLECNSYGDSVGSTPVCGNDGQDYANWCELRMASCKTMTEIKVKYYGKCSKYWSGE